MSDDMVRAAAQRLKRRTARREEEREARRRRAFLDPPDIQEELEYLFPPTADHIPQLRAELTQDLEFVELNYQKNREMTRRLESTADPTEFDYAALGYTIHNLYNALESYFLRVAKFFENNLEQTAWHRSLIERMTLQIPGVRNALLTQADRIQIEELMRFRHLFRNLYKTPLVPEKLLYANRQVEGIDALIETRHAHFDDFLSALAAEMNTETET